MGTDDSQDLAEDKEVVALGLGLHMTEKCSEDCSTHGPCLIHHDVPQHAAVFSLSHPVLPGYQPHAF